MRKMIRSRGQSVQSIKALFIEGGKRIADYTLVALTIMIAESRPEEKEAMINVIMNCLV